MGSSSQQSDLASLWVKVLKQMVPSWAGAGGSSRQCFLICFLQPFQWLWAEERTGTFFFNVILAFALAFHQVAGTMLGAFPFMSCSVPTTTCEVAVSSMSWMRNLRQEVMSFPSSPNLSSRHHSWCSSSEMNTGVSSVGTPGPFSSHHIYLFVSSFMRNRP